MSDALPAVQPDEARLAAEIDRLKVEFPRTRELYREVCALLFFRFGQTPTANRLYQLVRRGSMGTPAAVLGEFWAELREKSRVRIDHPDLPADLGAAAGELVATLWTRATASAGAALDTLRDEVEPRRRSSSAPPRCWPRRSRSANWTRHRPKATRSDRRWRRNLDASGPRWLGAIANSSR
jgi:Plasmid replication region DNA-binding N-term